MSHHHHPHAPTSAARILTAFLLNLFFSVFELIGGIFPGSVATSFIFEDFICNSDKMKKVLSDILKVSRYDCNVIIFGDTGVGKEKAANIIQKNSDRKMQPFLKINCGAISPGLIESEFFGYEKGAFTGANANGKKGYFEMANDGVLFLDEIGEIPLEMQAKLLRVLQKGR